LWIFGLNLGIFYSPTWQIKLMAAGMWSLAVGSLTTRQLRSDLARWWILRSLPVGAAALLRAELRLAWMVVVLMGWLAILISHLKPVDLVLAVILLPFLVANTALAATVDILRCAIVRAIMSPSIAEENVPPVDIWGVVGGIISVLVPLGLLLVAITYPRFMFVGVVAVILAVVIGRITFREAIRAFNAVR
jgi:hypothetical protein